MGPFKAAGKVTRIGQVYAHYFRHAGTFWGDTLSRTFALLRANIALSA